MKLSHGRFKQKLSKLNGVSTPFGGASWVAKDSDRTIAKRLISFLEDRRILFVQHNWECRDECIDSANKMREKFTEETAQLDSNSELSQRISIMRQACRDFLNRLREHELSESDRDYNFVPQGAPRDALDSLRGIMGQHIFWLACDYELDVEEDLASAYPEYLTND